MPARLSKKQSSTGSLSIQRLIRLNQKSGNPFNPQETAKPLMLHTEHACKIAKRKGKTCPRCNTASLKLQPDQKERLEFAFFMAKKSFLKTLLQQLNQQRAVINASGIIGGAPDTVFYNLLGRLIKITLINVIN